MKFLFGIVVGVFVLMAVSAPSVNAVCTCTGGTPTKLTFQSTVGTGSCGHLDADGNPNFYQLACGGLYFGGVGVGVPLPATLPDQTSSIINVSSCTGTALTLSAATSTQTGSNRNCTNTSCLFGGPLSIPNTSHMGAATSTCVINVISSPASGSADCSTGTTTLLNVPLASNIYLTGDLVANRCTEDGSSCPTVGAKCGPLGKGKCVQDQGRCKGGTTPPGGTPCTQDSDCDAGAGATCETGQCLGGTANGQGCTTSADCPGTALGGDDGGCIPGSKNQLKCGDGITKALSKLATTTIKCHLKQEAAAFAVPPAVFDEEACEDVDPVKHKAAKEAFAAAIVKIRPICTPGQLIAANQMRDTLMTYLEQSFQQAAFCEGSSPIDPGGDDAGNIPSSKDSKKCADGIAKSASKLTATVFKCHIKAVDSAFKAAVPPFDEEACEQAGGGKGAHEVFTAGIAKLTTCTGCQAGGNPEALATAIISMLENFSPLAYPCGVCDSLIQPCPICTPVSNKCAGGPNDGGSCTPADSFVNGSYPTSHDCPPPAGNNIGALPIGFALTTGTSSKVSVDLPDQVNVFCGFCRNKVTNQFKNPAVTCTSNTDCSAVTGFTSCGQKHSAAFTVDDVARTITTTGSAAGSLTTGGAAKSSTLVSVFCIPPTFNNIVDGAGDLPGPGVSTLPGLVSLQ